MVGSPPTTPSTLTYKASSSTILASSYTNIFIDTSPPGCGTVNACALYDSTCTTSLSSLQSTYVTIANVHPWTVT